MRRSLLSLLFLVTVLTAIRAQRTYNLTAPQVRIDSVLPRVSFSLPLTGSFQDSIYSVSIDYPEFIPMSHDDVARLQRITDAPLPRLPHVSRQVSISRKQGSLDVSMVPLVKRGRRYQKLVSFVLRVESRPLNGKKNAPTRTNNDTLRYASHSVLSAGRWVKLRVAATGIHQLSHRQLQQAGFSDPSRVSVFGYGGHLQPEQLTADYLAATDDLHEVATTMLSDGRLLFHARGPVGWDDNHQRIRNPYSDYGYYFLTERDAPLRQSLDEWFASVYPSVDDYHTLYEVDDYAWYQGGRNLFDARRITQSNTASYTLRGAADNDSGSLSVVLTADQATPVAVSVNGTQIGTLSVEGRGSYDEMRTASATFPIGTLRASNTVTLTPLAASATVRLDYLSLYHATPIHQSLPDASSTYPAPETVGAIDCQDLHADGPADMVIIIPANRKLQGQAERLKTFHEQHDNLRVRIVAADQLYHEFSSGTPDANAYRRYLKMLYDRAQTDDDQPRYLLLMGDGAWDNRMRTATWQAYRPEEMLLCYESENSGSHTDSYVCDDYFTLLDDGEGANLMGSDKSDVAVGRLPVRTESEAQAVVDKIIGYAGNDAAGSWQNTVCMMGDDGNDNQHMKDADDAATLVEQMQPDLLVKRIMWDAYPRTSTATENTYPDVTRLIRQQMAAGALVMNYSGHGASTTLSHEKVIGLSDFSGNQTTHLPLWLTASCDIMPFDGQGDNIGEAALLNPQGGAMAFYGTTRTVYQSYNRLMNLAVMRHLMTGRGTTALTIGEAVRRAKNDLINTGSDLTANKLQYTLLGDPAIKLQMPTQQLHIDSINGISLANATAPIPLSPGTTATVSGHVERADGSIDTSFDGRLTATVLDAAETIVCRRNDTSEAQKAFTYTDRQHTLFTGNDSVSHGLFTFAFTVPRDIRYTDATGLINLFAADSRRQATAHGHNSQFTLGGSDTASDDHEGPHAFCYLNSSDFMDGDRVNTTPYFIAELEDPSGINATGNGLGHDLTLTIDGETTMTYNLNEAFTYDFGSHTRGTVAYSIPALSEGPHTLTFRAWDMQNNATTQTLTCYCVEGLRPNHFDVALTHNPATTSTGFRILHDRMGTTLDITVSVYDMSGRPLWQHRQQTVASEASVTIDWNLSTASGSRLPTGVYLYRVAMTSNGSQQVSKAKKLIILSNK